VCFSAIQWLSLDSGDCPAHVIPENNIERQVSVMQEDVLGTRRAAVSETYVNCARCGKATRLRYARVVQSDVLSDSHSEFEYICPECQKALAAGEKELPLT
jgi:DNA-directed RNA polymerase subunit RPC12/RpoP